MKKCKVMNGKKFVGVAEYEESNFSITIIPPVKKIKRKRLIGKMLIYKIKTGVQRLKIFQ